MGTGVLSQALGIGSANAAGVPSMMVGGSRVGAPPQVATQPPAGLFGAATPPKDQSRLNNLDVSGVVPSPSPFRMDAPPSDPNAPTPVKTQIIDPRTGGMFGAAVPGKTETVQGVPMEGGVMLADPSAKPGQAQVLPSATANAAPRGGVPDIILDVMNAKANPPTTLPGVPPEASAPTGGMFDTTAPRAPGTPPPAAAPTGFWGSLQSGLQTAQGKLKELPTNPMAQVGLALAASGYDGSNPYARIQQALGGIQAQELAKAAGAREDKKTAETDADAQLRTLIGQMMMAQNRNAPGTTPPRSAEGQARVIR
jgi:hypothetical protein